MSRTVIVNSKGQVMPTCIRKERRDSTPITFDFSNLMTVDSYTIEGDAPVLSDAQSGNRITVTLDAGQTCRTFDLSVIATGSGETRAATVQIQSTDRERGWNAFGQDYV